MSEPARHLHVVDAETGETLERCPSCAELEDQLAGAERELRAWRARYAELKRDVEADAKKDPLWPSAVRLFEIWKRECRHPRSAWSAARFEQAKPYLQRHGFDLCVRAIYGQAFDPFITERKNGTKKRHDGWHLIFGKPEQFEEAVNKAPLDRLFEAEETDGAPNENKDSSGAP